jgi:hypothetical protein
MVEAYRGKGGSNLGVEKDAGMRKKRKERGEERKGEKRPTGSDRSVNLGTKGRVVQLGEADLVWLMADVAFHFGDIRSDLNGDVRDGVDGGVGGVS